MAELLVCIAARNAERTVAAAIASVLAQRESDLQVVVIDDASSDATGERARSVGDPRVGVERSERALGAAACWQLALERSAAPFFAVLGADAVALPGALATLVAALERAPEAAMAHAYSFAGMPPRSREAYRRRRARLEATIGPGVDLGETLRRSGNVLGPLRVYRREALAAVGGFRAEDGGDADLETTLRLVARFTVAMVPRHLAAIAEAPDAADTPSVRRRGRPLFITTLPGRLETFYERITSWLAPFAVRLLPPADAPRRRPGGRVAYYLWRFPVLSQTFIHRELAALKRAGVPLAILADEAGESELADDDARAVADDQIDLPPRLLPPRIGAAEWRTLRRQPLRALRLFAFVTLCRHSPHKHVLGDRAVFARAATLAAALEQRGIDHLHSPWADRSAMVALIAARLLRIPFSMQARAHDLHRRSYEHGRREICAGARFVITNTEYNRRHLVPFLAPGREGDVVVIRNGLDLAKLTPKRHEDRGDQPLRILCVARLIEQKGILDLLEACAQLHERGLRFHCEIVGDAELPLYANYLWKVRKLHCRLALADCVTLRGALPFAEVLERYRGSDLVVLPSVVAEDGSRDIIPNVLLEAMALGIPVVATTVTGIPELVDQGVEGLLVPPHDVAALAEALARLIGDPALRAELGRNGRARAERDFDVDRNVARTVELFAESLRLEGRDREPRDRADLGKGREALPVRTTA